MLKNGKFRFGRLLNSSTLITGRIGGLESSIDPIRSLASSCNAGQEQPVVVELQVSSYPWKALGRRILEGGIEEGISLKRTMNTLQS